MAPEAPADLVVLNLYFEGDKPKAKVEAIERTHEMRIREEPIRVSWAADKTPDGFFAVGDGAAYVRGDPKPVTLDYSVDLEVTGRFSYSWRYPTAGSIMIVLIFPSGYVLTDSNPSPVRAKVIQNGRLAAYWILEGPNRAGGAEVNWTMERSERDVASTATRINNAAIKRRPDRGGPVVLEPGSTGDRLAAWVLGTATTAFLMLLIFFGPSDLPPDYKPIVRFIAALAGGLLSYFFVGNLHLGGKLPGLDDVRIAAVGGFAVFAFIMLFWSH
jgi:hypothetical protein